MALRVGMVAHFNDWYRLRIPVPSIDSRKPLALEVPAEAAKSWTSNGFTSWVAFVRVQPSLLLLELWLNEIGRTHHRFPKPTSTSSFSLCSRIGRFSVRQSNAVCFRNGIGLISSFLSFPRSSTSFWTIDTTHYDFAAIATDRPLWSWWRLYLLQHQ